MIYRGPYRRMFLMLYRGDDITIVFPFLKWRVFEVDASTTVKGLVEI